MKKLYYVPGLISLVLLPIILYYFPQEQSQSVIRVFLPYDDMDTSASNFKFSKGFVLKYIKNRIPITIDLDDYEGLDDYSATLPIQKLQFIQQEARRLKFTYDTTHYLRIHFAYEISFAQFVDILNIMMIDRHRRYALLDRDFYIFADPRSTALDDPPIEFTIPDIAAHQIKTYQKPWRQRWKEQIDTWLYKNVPVIKAGKWILISFLLLIIIPSIFFIRKIINKISTQ